MPEQSAMFMKGPYDPLVIERAEGPWLYTRDGRKILDAAAGAVVVNIGQGRAEVAQVDASDDAKDVFLDVALSVPLKDFLTLAAYDRLP